DFDLFIVQDAGSIEMVSRRGKVEFPSYLKTIVIDHHASNPGFGTCANLVDATYPSVTLVLFDLFKEWGIQITPDIAADLFIGAYTDTGGFRYDSVTSAVFSAASELTSLYPSFSKLISDMENNRKPGEIISLGLLLSEIKTYLGDHIAVASLSNEDLTKHRFDASELSTSWASGIIRSVVGWDIDVCCVEASVGVTKASFRTRDAKKYDLSKLALALGGGGHKAAAGAVITMPLPQAIEKIVATAKEIYNL
ncbi:MAG: DHHA1 domain-containing protein, partial [Candidatus Pacebacteria bacterium]|nr:DHHA1 domain-containing protein [Candidatus Paceibacterota bacterium]